MTSWLNVVGTNHISKESVENLKSEFLSYKPDIIAVELDKGRLEGLLSENVAKKRQGFSAIRSVGVRGYLFLLIGSFVQKKLGKLVGVKPGSEMLFAINLARNNNLKLALIDKPINITIKRLFKKLTFKEKTRFLSDILFAPFKKKQMKKLEREIGLNKRNVSKLLSSVPDQQTINALMLALKDRYPTFYSVLVAERNHYMAKKIVIIHKQNLGKKILAVVGAGHEKEIIELVKHYFNSIEIV